MRLFQIIRPRLMVSISLGVGVTLFSGVVSSLHASEVNVTNDPSHRWGEQRIAVNPKNPNNIVMATVGTGSTTECQAHSPDCQLVSADLGLGIKIQQSRGMFTNPDFTVVAAFVSFDRGKTWKRAHIPVIPAGYPDLSMPMPGDPCVTVTPDGTFYFSFDDLNWGTPEHGLPSAGVGVVKSTDGGLSWTGPVLTGTPVDGPSIVADTNTGTVYAASSTYLGPRSTGDAKAPQGKINTRWLASSMDGVHWTTPQPMGGFAVSSTAAHGVLATAFKTTGQNGMFSAANNELCGDKPAPCMIFETTKDSGATWSRHVMAVAIPSGSQVPDQPLVAADPAKEGHFAVAVPMEGKGYNVYRTRDAGNTWSGPAIVSEDSSKRHYHGALAFSRRGILGLMWRTSQPKAGETATAPADVPGVWPGFPYNVWAAVSRDGGATFSEPLKVSGEDSPAPQPGQFASSGDDYSSIAVDADYVYVGWAAWRPVERQNFFNALKLEEFKLKR